MSRRPLTVLADTLRDLARVVAQLGAEEFANSGIDGVSGSIGGHVRHCLDHVRALEEGLQHGLADYERRERQSAIERDRDAALAALGAAIARLGLYSDDAVARPMRVRLQIDQEGSSAWSDSSGHRELAFVVGHTVHHSAAIALLVTCRGLGRLPARFGLAAGTPDLREVA